MDPAHEILCRMNNHIESIKIFHVKRIGIFGSFVRGEQREGSDLDVLVEFDDNQETLDNYMNLKFFLEELYDRKVDLVIAESIKEAMKKSILESVRYAKGA